MFERAISPSGFRVPVSRITIGPIAYWLVITRRSLFPITHALGFAPRTAIPYHLRLGSYASDRYALALVSSISTEQAMLYSAFVISETRKSIRGSWSGRLVPACGNGRRCCGNGRRCCGNGRRCCGNWVRSEARTVDHLQSQNTGSNPSSARVACPCWPRVNATNRSASAEALRCTAR